MFKLHFYIFAHLWTHFLVYGTVPVQGQHCFQLNAVMLIMVTIALCLPKIMYHASLLTVSKLETRDINLPDILQIYMCYSNQWGKLSWKCVLNVTLKTNCASYFNFKNINIRMLKLFSSNLLVHCLYSIMISMISF